MDFQGFIDCVDMPSCVMSVEKLPDGKYGMIRIVCFNAAYREVMGPGVYADMPYYELVPHDKKFEDFCFRAAVLHQRMHAYVEVRGMQCWIDQTMIPLVSDREDMGYCQFIFEKTQYAEAERMASMSVGAAEKVIEACIKLVGSEDIRQSVGDALDVIIAACGAKAARILLVDDELKRVDKFCDRVAENHWHQLAEDAITYDLITTWEQSIGVSNDLIIKDAQDMREMRLLNPAWAKSLEENRVETLVLIPLRQGKRVIGYLYVINFDTPKVLMAKELVELMSFFLGSEIANHLLLQKLEEISEIDALTGISNRRAMISRMKQMAAQTKKTAFGVVNVDLNGLKTVNDGDGHEAGDKLLVQTGEILKKVFYEDDLYRTGGDEFIVISRDIDRKTFERKVRRLRSDVEKNADVSFAIGEYWSDGSVEVPEALRLADEKMYMDKRAFYEKRPDMKR